MLIKISKFHFITILQTLIWSRKNRFYNAQTKWKVVYEIEFDLAYLLQNWTKTYLAETELFSNKTK